MSLSVSSDTVPKKTGDAKPRTPKTTKNGRYATLPNLPLLNESKIANLSYLFLYPPRFCKRFLFTSGKTSIRAFRVRGFTEPNSNNGRLTHMTLRITQYGESILHEKNQAVTDFSDKLFNLSRDMIDAAPRRGHRSRPTNRESLCFCVIEFPTILIPYDLHPGWQALSLPLSNPCLWPTADRVSSGDEFPYEEGCLSLPGSREAPRPNSSG